MSEAPTERARETRTQLDRWLDAVLIALAAINLAAGCWMSLQPRQAADMQRVAGWAGMWLSEMNPYADPALAVDYPPWALVLLSPLSLIGSAWRPPVWLLINLALAGALIALLVQPLAERRALRWRLALVLASTACLRTLTQFSLLAYVLALAGARLRPPVLGAALLGLSLMKPQIGGVIALCLLLMGDWKRVAYAALVPLLVTALFLARTWVDPSTLLAQQAAVLLDLYGSPAALPGHTELRTWLWTLWPDVSVNITLTIGVALILVLPAVTSAARRRLWTGDDALQLLGLCGVVSLLAQRHLSYDYILLLPAVVAWRTVPFSNIRRDHAWIFFMLAGLLVAALPSWWRLADRYGASFGLEWLTQLDRVLCLCVWAVLAWRLNRASIDVPARAAVGFRARAASST